jgi:hypothetical protein
LDKAALINRRASSYPRWSDFPIRCSIVGNGRAGKKRSFGHHWWTLRLSDYSSDRHGCSTAALYRFGIVGRYPPMAIRRTPAQLNMRQITAMEKKRFRLRVATIDIAPFRMGKAR